MRFVFIFLSTLTAERSEHFAERCWPSGVDKECNFQCIKTFVFQMKDHSTVVTENRSQLKACRATCKTKECQPTTKAPPTTKSPVTSLPRINKYVRIANTLEEARRKCPDIEYSHGTDKFGRYKETRTRVYYAIRRAKLWSGKDVFEVPCHQSFVREYKK